MSAQAKAYGVEIIDGRVTACTQGSDGFRLQTTAGTFAARAVVLATGVDVTPPEMDGLETAIARGFIRYCPVCDGYEAIGSRIGVLGGRSGSIEEAHFLLTFSEDVTYLPMPDAPPLDGVQLRRAREAGIRIARGSCAGLALREDAIEVRLSSGDTLIFDTIYPCLGSQPRSSLAQTLGARISKDGELITDARLATNVAGLYAVGDVLHGLDQVASACGQAAIAAAAIHNALRERDRSR